MQLPVSISETLNHPYIRYHISRNSGVVGDASAAVWSVKATVSMADYSAASLFAVELWNDGKEEGSHHAYISGAQMTFEALQGQASHKPRVVLNDTHRKAVGSVELDWELVKKA